MMLRDVLHREFCVAGEIPLDMVPKDVDYGYGRCEGCDSAEQVLLPGLKDALLCGSCWKKEVLHGRGNKKRRGAAAGGPPGRPRSRQARGRPHKGNRPACDATG